MAMDSQHKDVVYRLSEMDHFYGPNVHILSSPMMLSLLAKLGSPEAHQPVINQLVEFLYGHLIDETINLLFPKKFVSINTRMQKLHPEAVYEGQIIDPDIPCVTVGLARAGTFPSHLCYQKLNYLMNPNLVRQDHFYVARSTNEKGEVVGVNVSGSKIGGSIENAIVIFPDPMGATGSTIVEVYRHYKNTVGGKPLIMIALHLVITPEYLMKVKTHCPDLHIMALRLDRGLSSQTVLSEVPGAHWKLEKGLNDHHYIVPGAGGLGEIMNNSYC